jgi:endo-1,4-beta-mannosidase
MPDKVRFGVNYVPRKHWWYCWLNWDRQSISDDLEAIAALGMDHIRIQCLWPYFQPGINYINDVVLERLRILLDCADRAGLDVEVTVLNGWMSGLSFMPPWVAPLANDRNIFRDAEVIAAEKLLFRRIAERIGNHPRFLGFDLGNEIGCLMGMNPVTQTEADTWANEMFAYCYQVAPGRFHVNGVDHSSWFSDFGFTRENLATAGSASIVHSYALPNIWSNLLTPIRRILLAVSGWRRRGYHRIGFQQTTSSNIRIRSFGMP